MDDVLTRGNVIVNKIQIGDILYEFKLSCGIVVKVLTKPQYNEKEGVCGMVSREYRTKQKITYRINPKYPHYASNLYDYKVYKTDCCVKNIGRKAWLRL